MGSCCFKSNSNMEPVNNGKSGDRKLYTEVINVEDFIIK